MFKLNPDSIIKVNRGDGLELLQAIETADRNNHWQSLNEHYKIKAKFRSINLDFVSKLRQSSLFETIELKNRNFYKYD